MTAFFRLILALLVLTTAAAVADEITLRNGEVLKGTVTVMDDAVKIDLEDGRSMMFPSAEVEKIVRSAAEPTVAPADPEGARQQAEASRLIEELVKADSQKVATSAPDWWRSGISRWRRWPRSWHVRQIPRRRDATPMPCPRSARPTPSARSSRRRFRPTSFTRALGAEKLTAFRSAESARR